MALNCQAFKYKFDVPGENNYAQPPNVVDLYDKYSDPYWYKADNIGDTSGGMVKLFPYNDHYPNQVDIYFQTEYVDDP
jgi:hypothetical protein